MTGKILAESYEVQRILGKQTGRQTLLARDLQTQELVVIKQLFLGSDFEWQDLKLFEREAETLKALSHPGIPRHLDYLEIDEPDSKSFALVQTYVEGKTLEEHLRCGRTFSESEVKELAKLLLAILMYLHEQNPPVIHRDIKPSNILLHSRSGHSVGQVYLVDFGSVQNQAAKFGGTITVVGTYGYMAPEQFGGRSVPASDLYGLGGTLIYLVTGLHPMEISQQDLKIQFADRAKHLNPNLIHWLEWMTEPSLEKRLSSADKAFRSLDENPCAINKIKKNPLVVQPPESDIKLTKNSEFIEIIIPPKEVDFSLIAWFSAAVAANILLRIGGSNYLSVINNLLRNSLIMLSGSLLAAVVVTLLSALFRELRVRIDRHQISYTSNLLGLKWNYPRSMSRQEICQLEIRQYNSNIYQMLIQAGKQKYQLGENQGLSESEITWLATELSQWLGLKIKKTLTEGKNNIWF
ncbi:MAG: serine/threonine protein kinase [Oscillatoriales cyanobacterium]|uniref:serine/threonine protein kinase n=1 Tax=unclassified Microcoleus TaxID=2642155 RepID=UPI001D9D42C1|nr:MULTISPECIES: serine/threonine-protein kinase [unclassified Microcoleus]TAF84441.1 MAG: serine/threonine protein kinase [Oscillatoriales cyanobacterium]MCC3435257.1 serine/threonine protein kinase [Microcoleus sp. PH2017_05_CCC_O_A]MCC3451540.1 serine/threonine protein kinase [Microcoleus sp. PH2017_09_SFU_O_A]MCC3632430.1 serine/threonine protein kinase [Microcoleus sp. PH2017_39_LGB_O_B]MCC3644643.1 serine/threonine protein kinase [Microcoleus sp. PH2017_33_LGB_O_A]